MRGEALVVLAVLVGCATEPSAVTGELRKSETSGWSVRDCLTGEVFRLSGAPLSAPPAGAGEVIVRLEGQIADGSPRVLSVARVGAMRRGSCDDPVPSE